MALLIAPLFTAGIVVGGIQNANAGVGDFTCGFTAGTGTAEVTLNPGDESDDINKSVVCEVVNNNGGNSLEIENVTPDGVASC